MRWNKRYDGSNESLRAKSYRPLTPHPNSHTGKELKWIQDLYRRNPDISVSEMYGKLKLEKGYKRHPCSLYRVFVRLGYRKKTESTKEKSKHSGKYDTPTELGIKWQMDVKYVPKVCYVSTDGENFYQYTAIEETSLKRFIYAYKEQSSYSSVDFFKKAIVFFGYAPETVQTDNGGEFCHTAKTLRVHPFDVFCNEIPVIHKTIRPRTPWHNGKVEKSHRNDQQRFYDFLRIYSFEDLQNQMKRYLYRSNNIPMSVLGWISPNQMQRKLAAVEFISFSVSHH